MPTIYLKVRFTSIHLANWK